jgi:hypothetical protein
VQYAPAEWKFCAEGVAVQDREETDQNAAITSFSRTWSFVLTLEMGMTGMPRPQISGSASGLPVVSFIIARSRFSRAAR